MTLLQGVSAALAVTGALLMLLASVGILRMPDLYMRMSAATKASSLGAGFLLAAVAVHFAHPAVTGRAVAAIFFIFLTVPVAAHMVARAAYLAKIPISGRTRHDELAGRYDARTFQLQSREEDRP